MLGTLGLAFLAGVLSTLSPCVLPLLPIVLGAAATEHPLGPLALAGGLCLSFVAIGLVVATAGHAIGLDGQAFRVAAAFVMLALGLVIALPPLQARFALAAGPVSNWAGERLGQVSGKGVLGQFGLGMLLGAVWSPCVGPTLGAASVLASQGVDLGRVASTMAVFGFGAALPLLLIGSLSRATLTRWRHAMLSTGSGLKAVFGGVLIVVGAAILFGFDKGVEAKLVELSPDWLTGLTTRF